MKEKLERLRQLLVDIMGSVPSAECLTANLRHDRSLDLVLHGLPNYAAGTEFLRGIGIGERKKTIVNEHQPDVWIAVEGKIGEHNVQCFCKGLPDSCKLVKFTERIPKSMTTETGEFVEVERYKVVCGADGHVAGQPEEMLTQALNRISPLPHVDE